MVSSLLLQPSPTSQYISFVPPARQISHCKYFPSLAIVHVLKSVSADAPLLSQYVIGGLYAIVLVTALNRRQSSRGRADGPTSISLSDADNFGSHPRANGAAPASVRTPPQFQVNVMRNNDQHDAGSDSDYGDAGSPVPRKAARFDQDIMVSVRTEVHKDGSIRYGEKENSFVAI